MSPGPGGQCTWLISCQDQDVGWGVYPMEQGEQGGCGVTVGPSGPTLGAPGQAAHGILEAEVSCGWRGNKLTCRDLGFLPVMPQRLDWAHWELHQ